MTTYDANALASKSRAERLDLYWSDELSDHADGVALILPADLAAGRGEQWLCDVALPDAATSERLKPVILAAIAASVAE